MSPGLVLFDCDGTLVDSQHVIHEAMACAFSNHDLTPLPRRNVRQVIGLPLDKVIERLHPAGSSDQIAGLAQSYKETFVRLRQRVDHHEPLFDGMREVIEVLAAGGALLGGVTGKGSQGLSMVLSQHRLDDRFVALQTDNTAPGKPDPGMVYQAIAETGAASATTVVISDTSFGMAMAVAAGVPGTGVAWGYHPSDQLRLAGARCIVEAPGDPIAVIDGLVGSGESR